METLIHPITGEQGFFCSQKEKKVIDIGLTTLASHIEGEDGLE